MRITGVSLFTNRYERQANDRLHEDFEELSDALTGEGCKIPPLRIFDDQYHPLYRAAWLVESAGWIGRSRIGKALVAMVLATEPTPIDWITGEPLRPTHVRQLEQGKNLDRHHVFPKKVLLAAGVSRKEIDNGLNGVVLDKRTNRRFWKYPPDEYVRNITKKRKIKESELLERIAGHFVPHKAMVNTKSANDSSVSKIPCAQSGVVGAEDKRTRAAARLSVDCDVPTGVEWATLHPTPLGGLTYLGLAVCRVA